MKVKGSVIVLTGASGGLGEFMARRLASAGAKLVLAARSVAKLDALGEELRAAGGDVLTVPTDVTREEDLVRLVQRTETEMGPVDVLINNAGVHIFDYIEDIPREAVQGMMDLNVVALIRLTQLVLPGMKERLRGQIVNIGSMSGVNPAPFGEVYSASKHAVFGFSRSLRVALELDNLPIGVTCICPGYISEVGMYAQSAAESGGSAGAFLGTSTPDAVVRAVIRSIRRNPGDIHVNPGTPRLNATLGMLFPRFLVGVARRLGAFAFIHNAARKQRSARASLTEG